MDVCVGKINCVGLAYWDLDWVFWLRLFCGTGTPEAGGVSFTELLNAVFFVAKTNIVGFDVNELAPMLDISGASTATACKIVREMLLAFFK